MAEKFEARGSAAPLADLPPGMIGIPAQEQMWTASACAIFGGLRTPPGTMFGHYGNSHSIALKRNAIVEGFLTHSELEWLCFIDSDMVPAPDTIEQLLRADRDIVSGLCFTRNPPYFAAAFRHVEGPDSEREWHPMPHNVAPGQLVEVDASGAACLLIRRHVMESIAAPWFEHSSPGTGEDSYFCAKAIASGFKIHVHTGVVPGHIGVVNVNREFMLHYYGNAIVTAEAT